MYNIPTISLIEAEGTGLVEHMIFSPENEIIDSQFGTLTYNQYLVEEANRILRANANRHVAIVRHDRMVSLFVDPVGTFYN